MHKLLLGICLGLSLTANAQFEDVNAVAEDLIFLTENIFLPQQKHLLIRLLADGLLTLPLKNFGMLKCPFNLMPY